MLRKVWRKVRPFFLKVDRNFEVWGFGAFSPAQDVARKSLGDQKGQVSFLINYVFDYQNEGLRKNGYFVDLAAGDGIYKSNTYFLEKHLGWRGLLIEANPEYAANCRIFRASKVVESCVWDTDGETVDFRLDNGYFGGIISESTDNNQALRGEEIKSGASERMSTRTLQSIFEDYNVPQVVDFLSLDVEGAEEMILKHFPFETWSFKAITIERPTVAIDILLDKHGYVQVAHLDYDVFYVPRQSLQKVNFDPKVIFALTPRKDF